MEVADLSGVWRRSLLAWGDGRRDASSTVEWVQGARYFVDLRQPAGRPDVGGVGSLRAVPAGCLDWLARQEGFAGELRQEEGGVFHWVRLVDLQPASVWRDRGRLSFGGAAGVTLVEEGVEQAYVEHWHAVGSPPASCAGFGLRDPRTGRRGFLVRVGQRFGYARDRPADLGPGRSLIDLLGRRMPPRSRQDLIDCEISLGVVAGDEWTITRSSLPFREGHTLGPRFLPDGRVLTEDVHPDGTPFTRRWDVTDTDGNEGALPWDGR
jgi:hypothetical protein